MRTVQIGVVAVLIVAVAVAASADGYVVILKNGHKIPCRDPLRIDGANAILTLVTGTVASYPVDQVDLVATERYNQQGLGDALVIDELSLTGTPIPTPTPKRSLGQFASIDAGSRDPELSAKYVPTPTPTPGIKLQPTAYHDERVDRAFTKYFDDRNLLIYRTSAGTRPEYFFVQTVTDSQREVFEALRIVTDAFALILKLQPELAPTAVELQMIETTGRASGTFRITPEMARSLAEKRVSMEQFYVDHVIF
ncbi:MAG TPA: hypothetical protein PKJ99_02035 [Thermoanaerobaculales bacterium]|nr:hypothetical protein [Thermoanaerobaculales bacterium]HPA81022.1 hypothetical protein [Thermoanaerobaculales bacterium]HQL29405.1 hypothetical protein [Thermoanaerobaculales bacterium]HQN95563.1 hypothetical protein [Thermoanaerobaculales bacterium]HQP44411.1 hypothetical protein [Thermoanaerobaculales bacterium]